MGINDIFAEIRVDAGEIKNMEMAFVRWEEDENVASQDTYTSYAGHLSRTYVHNGNIDENSIKNNKINIKDTNKVKCIYCITSAETMRKLLEEARLQDYFAERGADNDAMHRLFYYDGQLKRDYVRYAIRHYIAFLNNDPQMAQLNVRNRGQAGIPDAPTQEIRKDEKQNQQNGLFLQLNTILYGPPGTGKTYRAMQEAVKIIDGKVDDNFQKRHTILATENRIVFTTFHQSYGYEEFIEGIRPNINDNKQITYDVRDGVFKNICKQAVEDKNNKYVIIIDEINRGNISKIFGELITLIEPSKRLGDSGGVSAILPYSGESFGVPENVYIIGTMNTADRSIALMDTALRRRFDFIEMTPLPKLLKDIIIGDIDEGINIGNILHTLNRRIEVLLDREHKLGHAYFWELRDDGNRTIERLGNIFEKNIIPILQEYFFDDYEKIRLILGDNQKVNNEPEFIKKERDSKLANIFGNDASEDVLDICTTRYRINRDAFTNYSAYKFLNLQG